MLLLRFQDSLGGHYGNSLGVFYGEQAWGKAVEYQKFWNLFHLHSSTCWSPLGGECGVMWSSSLEAEKENLLPQPPSSMVLLSSHGSRPYNCRGHTGPFTPELGQEVLAAGLASPPPHQLLPGVHVTGSALVTGQLETRWTWT